MLETLLLQDSLGRTPFTPQTLHLPKGSCLDKLPEAQFGPLRPYLDGLLLTWSNEAFFVVDPQVRRDRSAHFGYFTHLRSGVSDCILSSGDCLHREMTLALSDILWNNSDVHISSRYSDSRCMRFPPLEMMSVSAGCPSLMSSDACKKIACHRGFLGTVDCDEPESSARAHHSANIWVVAHVQSKMRLAEL